MRFSLLIPLVASLSYANAAPGATAFDATFDDIPGSGLVPEPFLVDKYRNLNFDGFNVYNADEGVSLLKAPSRPNFGASITVAQILTGSPAMINTNGTSTKSFSVTSLYNACVVASQTGVLAQACTIQYTGTQTNGKKVTQTCSFAVPNLLAPQAALCNLKGFTDLKSLALEPVKATLLPASTVLLIDEVKGTTKS